MEEHFTVAANALLPEQPSHAAWPLPQRIIFRFLFCYFLLYSLPESGRVTFVSMIPGLGFLSHAYISAWHALVPWVAIHIFHLSGVRTTYFPTGSGDTTLAYVQNLCYLLFALLATIVWSLADYQRPDYRWLHSWLRVLVRYTLVFTLFSYGFAKVFPLQFGPPRFSQLIEPFGEFSPMGVLWSFMGASTVYIIFSGVAEVLGGLLLLFRRTSTLGALVSFAVLLNVMVLNFCYDVPVKLYSMNLVLMAVFLLANDWRRLLAVFVLNRPAAPADLSMPRFRRRWTRLTALAFQVLFVGFFLVWSVAGGWMAYSQHYLNPTHAPLYGLYEAESFNRNGQDLPPLVTDGTRWRKVAIDFPSLISIRMMDDSPKSYGSDYDAPRNIVTLSVREDPNQRYPFTYQRPDADHVLLQGTLAGDKLSVLLRRIDTSHFLLLNRGFHWISETPFNR